MSAAATLLTAMGIGRIILGVAPFVAAGPASRLLGFPPSQDSPTARLMGRFFGVRDIGLGVLTFWALRHPEALSFVLLFNAATDFCDLISTTIPLIGRHGIDRAALVSAGFAGSAMLAWLAMWLWVG
jgi:hypothetical protein